MALNNFRKFEITDEMISNLKKYIIESPDNIYEMRLNEKYKKVLIYPTDDVLLFEHQFHAITQLMSNDEELYIMQMGDKTDIFEKKNTVLSMDYPFEFSEYSEIAYYSLTLSFSSSFEWILVIDETFDGGIGVLIGEADKIKSFKENYTDYYNDLLSYIEVCLDEKNKTENVNNLSKIIHILMN